jgi:hypothetical protein
VFYVQFLYHLHSVQTYDSQVAFHGLGLNSSIILQAIGFGGDTSEAGPGAPMTGPDAYLSLRHICVGNLILSIAGLIPGYWVTFLFVDKWGRKPIQLMGFIALTVLFVVMGMFTNLPPLNGGRKPYPCRLRVR